MGTQQFCLKWNNHHSNMLSVFEQLLNNEALVDVTLACEGHSLKAHKVVLSACSPFFQTLFVDNPCKHPIVIMKDMRYVDMKAIIDFIYHGEVNVSQDQLSALLKTAETLKVKGLAEVGGEKQAERQNAQEVSQQPVTSTQTVSGNQHHRTESPLVHKRKRGRPRRRSGSSQSDTEEPIPSKIKEPDSPEIISDISRDGLNESTPDVSQRLPSVSQSRVPPIPSNQSYSLSSQKSHSMYSPVPSQQESSATIEEPPSITDGDFDVEPSRLMEATLTTDASGVSMYESQAQAALPSTSTSLALPPASAVELPQSNSLSQAIVPTSLHSASDSSGSGLGSQNTMEDIKPLVSFEEPPIGVTSHSHDSSSTNAVLPYMDTSGVPAIPGPSSFQPDMSMQPSPQQTSQEELFEDDPLSKDLWKEWQKMVGLVGQTNYNYSEADIGKMGHQKIHVPQTEKKRYPQRKCRVCSFRGRRRDTRVMCRTCDVGLCDGDCFVYYHAWIQNRDISGNRLCMTFTEASNK